MQVAVTEVMGLVMRMKMDVKIRCFQIHIGDRSRKMMLIISPQINAVWWQIKCLLMNAFCI